MPFFMHGHMAYLQLKLGNQSEQFITNTDTKQQKCMITYISLNFLNCRIG